MPHAFASDETDAVAAATAAGQFGPPALKRRAREVRDHYDRVCGARARYIAKNTYYFGQVCNLLRMIIPPGKRVLQVGCLTPDYLNAVEPSLGVGIDVSAKQASVAAERFPHLQFRMHENYEIGGQEIFDYILVMDVNDQVDPISALRALRPAMNERTRIIVHHYNHFWEPIIRLAERTGLKFPLPQQNWLSPGDLQNIFTLCDWERLQIRRAVLVPKYIPLLSTLANSFLSRLPVIQHLNMINLSIARPVARASRRKTTACP